MHNSIVVFEKNVPKFNIVNHYIMYTEHPNNNMNGIHIFRLAITKGTNTLKTELGIKNGIHRQKISVQAMDLVLFGPPKGKSNIADWIVKR